MSGDGGVCCRYTLVIASVQLNDSGLYFCTEHGDPPHDHALRTARLSVTGRFRLLRDTIRYYRSCFFNVRPKADIYRTEPTTKKSGKH